jgi:hypothetical protein
MTVHQTTNGMKIFVTPQKLSLSGVEDAMTEAKDTSYYFSAWQLEWQSAVLVL